MSKRSADPRQHEYDTALRTALHMAADSLEPGAEGLDQIRAKIAAKQSARRQLDWWSLSASGQDAPWWRPLVPPRDWFPAVVSAVVERFRPDPNRAGWFGWLRPAAAVVTGLFVVSAASLAVAALPSVLDAPVGSRPQHSTTPTHRSSSTTQHPSYTGTNGGTVPPGQRGGSTGPAGSTTPSCTPTASNSPSTSPSGSPSSSGSPSQSGSPSPSGTPSGTPTSTPSSSSTTPDQSSPTSSPTPAARGANAPVPEYSPEATGKALLSPDAFAASQLEPTPTNTPEPTGSPTVRGSPSPWPSFSLPPPC